MAQGLKIVLAVGTALIDGNFVVDVGSGNKAANCFAEFTQGMTADVQVSDLAPAVAVGLVVAGAAAVFVILAGRDGFVQGAEALGGQFRAAGVVAGVREFVGHDDHPFWTTEVSEG